MPNGGITKQTFEAAETEGKLNILFDQQTHMIQAMDDMKKTDVSQHNQYTESCASRYKDCDNRFKTIEIGWAKVVGGALIFSIIMPIISTMVIHAIF